MQTFCYLSGEGGRLELSELQIR